MASSVPAYRDVTIGALLTRLAAELPDREALVYADRDLRLTFAELEDPEFARFDLTTLRTGVMAGALCPELLMRRVIEQMNLRELTIIYGLTEASPGITQTRRDDTMERRTQTVGRVLPEVEVKIVEEVEDLLRGHPAVADVAVYAIKSEFFGEEVAASVRLHPGATATPEELSALCGDHLARFKIPRYFRFPDAFPQTASGKIQKYKLRETHESELGLAQPASAGN